MNFSKQNIFFFMLIKGAGWSINQIRYVINLEIPVMLFIAINYYEIKKNYKHFSIKFQQFLKSPYRALRLQEVKIA